METKERRNDEKKAVETWPNMSCCGTNASPGEIPDCCKSMFETDARSSMMSKCMRVFRWFPLVPVMLGIVFLLLGYYLDAAITRVLWMLVAGFVVLLGTFGLILAGRMKEICCRTK
jgi:hypothetical protein